MKNIPHYKDQEICNRDLPSLRDPQNIERIRKAQDEIKQLVDGGCWRDSRWYESFTGRFVEEVKKCRVFVDIGAEAGFYTYLALRNMPAGGKIIAFEPDPIRHQLLKEFFGQYENVKIFDFAVSDIEAVATFVKPRGQSATCADVMGEKFTARTVALDDFLQDEKIDIIKMDIEGGEANAFKGMRKILSRGNTTIFLELHYWIDEVFPGGIQFMEQLLQSTKYHIYNSDKGHLVLTEKLKGVRFYLSPEKKDARSNLIQANDTSFQIEELVLDFTRRCNSHCTYCGIWKVKDGLELELGAIESVFKAPQLQNLKTCYVTGGEPYISDKIIDIAALLHKYIPDCLLTGATNGIQCEEILARVLKIRDSGCKIEVHVSLNGTRSTHDATRGRSGYWDRAVTLLDKLIAHGISTIAAFSIMPQTAREMPYMQRFCAIRGISMEVVWVRRSERYQQVDEVFSTWPEAMKSNLQLIEYLPDYFDCPALQKRLVVTPDGSIYPCEIYLPALLLGNVNERPLEDILNDSHTAGIAQMVANRGCTWCQGPGEVDGSPKWMLMDCYRRQSSQARQTIGKRTQARYANPNVSEKILEQIFAPLQNVRPEQIDKGELPSAIAVTRTRAR